MKKIFKGIAKTLSLVVCALLVGFSLVACGANTSSNSNPGAVIENQSSTISDGSVNDISDQNSDEQETEDISMYMFSGMYSFTRELTFRDIEYKDLAELCKFFETKDLNGVHYAATNLGFNEFVKNITTDSISGQFFSMYFSESGKIGFFLSDDDGNFTQPSEAAEFDYSYSEGTYSFELGKDNVVTFEYDEETGTVTLHYQFVYESNKKTVVSPLFVKVTLDRVEHSENMFDGTQFEYVSGSANLKTTETNPLSLNEKLETLAGYFGFEFDEANREELFAKIIDILSTRKLSLNDDTTVIVTNHNGTYTICAANDSLFTLFGSVPVRVVSHQLDLTSAVETIELAVELGNSTSFTFTFSRV